MTGTKEGARKAAAKRSRKNVRNSNPKANEQQFRKDQQTGNVQGFKRSTEE